MTAFAIFLRRQASFMVRRISLAAAILLLFAISAAAWDQELIDAAKALGRGNANEYQRALLIARNKDMQRLALHGNSYISDDVYQKCQAWYVGEIQDIVEQEAGRMKLGVVKQKSKSTVFQAGTDMDMITTATTADEIRELQRRVNDRIGRAASKYTEKNPGRQVNSWVHANDIDLMGDASRTSARNFKEIAEINNFAYESPEAARFEAWQRQYKSMGKDAPPLDMGDMSAYMNEMQNGSRRRAAEIAETRRKLQEAAADSAASVPHSEAWVRVQELQADLHMQQAQQAKLIQRMDEATDVMMDNFPVKGEFRSGSTLAQRAKTRSISSNSIAPGLSNKFDEKLVQNAYARHMEALAAVAQEHPELSGQCADSIRRASENLSEAQRQKVLKNIQARNGDEVASVISDAVLGKAATEGADDAGKVLVSGAGDIKTTTSAARQNGAAAAEAIKGGRYSEAMDAVEEMDRNMARARGMAAISKTEAEALSEAAEEYRTIKKAAQALPAAERAKFIESKVNDLMLSGGFKERLAGAIKTAGQESELLKLMAAEKNPMRRSIMREMLDGTSASSRKLWQEVKLLGGELPIAHMMGALFVYIDAVDAAGRMESGDVDGAMRKAAEALVGAFGSAGTSIVMVIANLTIDAAKETGYSIAVNPQSLDDLLAGIINVKGWEGAEGNAGELETSVTALALKYTTQDELREHLKMLIKKYSEGSMDSEQIAEGKRKALYDKMEAKLLALWREKRLEFVGDFLDSLSVLDMVMAELKTRVEVEPDPVLIINRRTGRQSGEVKLRVLLDGPVEQANDVLKTLEGKLKKLGGSDTRLILALRQHVSWTLDGVRTDEAYALKFERIALEKIVHIESAGKHSFAAEVECQLMPISAITEAADGYGDYHFEALAPLWGLKWDYKEGWSYKYASPGYKSVFKPGDVVGTHMSKMERTWRLSDKKDFEAVLSDLTDAVSVIIKGKAQTLPGRAVVLTPILMSADTIKEEDFTYKWSGPVRHDGATAVFSSEKTGEYKIGLAVYREQDGKKIKEADAVPFIIEVMPPSAAQFSIGIAGRSNVKVGEDIALAARVSAGDRAAEILLDDPDIWIEWRIHEQVVETSDRFVAETAYPAVYDIQACLVWHGEEGDRVLASKSKIVEVVGPEGSQNGPDAGKPGSTDEDPDAEDQGPIEIGDVPDPEDNGGGATAPEPVTGEGTEQAGEEQLTPDKPVKSQTKGQDSSGPKKPSGDDSETGDAGVPAQTGGSSSSGGTDEAPQAGASEGDVFYGAKLSLDFSKDMSKTDTSEADKAFLEAMSRASRDFAKNYKPDETSLEAERRKAVENVLSADYKAQWYERFKGKDKSAPPKQPEAALDICTHGIVCPINCGKPSGLGAPDHSKSPVVSAEPNADWLNGNDTPATPPSAVKTKPVETPKPQEPKWRYVFHSSPTLTFDPPESESGRTSVTVDRMGEIKMWAEVQDMSKLAVKPVETAQITYRVKPPSFSIVCSPEGASVGQEVKAEVKASPAVPSGMITYFWSEPASGERMEYSENASVIGFQPRDAKPVALKVEARVPHYSDAIGSASASYQPAAFTLTAEVTGRTGPKPMVWSPTQKQLVPAPDKEFAVHEAIGIKATLSGGTLPDRILWDWKVNSGTTLRSSGLSDTISVSRSEPGAVTATVTAMDKDKRLLGTASVSCSISIGEDQMVPKVDPLKAEVQTATGKVVVGDELKIEATVTGGLPPYTFNWRGAQGKDASAVLTPGKAGKITVAVDVTDKMGKRITASKDITVEKPAPTEDEINKAKADALLKEGYALEKQGESGGAIAKYREAYALIKDKRILERIQILEDRIAKEQEEKERNAKADELMKQGLAKEGVKQWPEALDCYLAVKDLRDDASVRRRIDFVENEIKKEEKRKAEEEEALRRKARADELVAEGYEFEKSRKWGDAAGCYQESLKYDDNSKVRERIAYVKGQIAKEAALAEEARQREKDAARAKAEAAAGDIFKSEDTASHERAAELIKQGYSYERAENWSSALDSYRSALKLEANPKVEERIKFVSGQIRIQAEQLAAQKRKAEEAEARKREAARLEAARREAEEKREREKQEAARQEAARREAARREQERIQAQKAGPDLSGTYRYRDSDGEVRVNITRKGASSVAVVMSAGGYTMNMSGTLIGDRISLPDGVSLTILDDGAALRMTSDGESHILRK